MDFWEQMTENEVEAPEDVDEFYELMAEQEAEANKLKPWEMCGKRTMIVGTKAVVINCNHPRECPICHKARVDLWMKRIKGIRKIERGDWYVKEYEELPEDITSRVMFPTDSGTLIVVSRQIEDGDLLPKDDEGLQAFLEVAVDTPKKRRPSATKDLRWWATKRVKKEKKVLGFSVDASLSQIAKTIERLKGHTHGTDKWIDYSGVTQCELLQELVKEGHTVKMLRNSRILSVENIATIFEAFEAGWVPDKAKRRLDGWWEQLPLPT